MMNNKGFAITGFIYTIFVIFIVMLVAILGLFNSRKGTLDNLKKDVLNEMNNKTTIIGDYMPIGKVQNYVVKNTGYYNIIMNSPKVKTTNGSQISLTIFLLKDEEIKIFVGNDSFNNNEVEIKSNDKLIAKASYNTSNNYVIDTYNEFRVEDVVITSYIKTTGSVNIRYESERIKKNSSLNRVQYIKDCMSGNSFDNKNYFTEIQAWSNGDNKALTSSVDVDNKIIDNRLDTYYVSEDENKCVILDLGRTYNLDLIKVFHKANTTNYGGKTYVSLDGKDYTLVSINDSYEDENGISINAYEDEAVMQVGDVYVPIKNMYNAKWLRLYHYNNLDGKLYWDSLSQVFTENGYDSLHKQSILYNISNYLNKDNKYELLLEYSDIDGYNRWVQSSNPMTTVENVSGYKAINVSWNNDGWYGLAKSDSGSVLLDGAKDSINYGIGTIRSNVNGIKVNESKISHESQNLWIRIDQLKKA